MKKDFNEYENKAIDRISKLRETPKYKPNPLPGELTEDYPGQVSEKERIRKMTGFGEKLRDALAGVDK